MNLTAMRYKTYVWPHNPRVYVTRWRRTVAASKVPFGVSALTDLGQDCRVFSGEGEFVGKNAYSEFKKLVKVFESQGPGILIHPVWQSASAYFVGLTLRQEPRADYVAYSFEFWEYTDGYGGALVKVKSAQTAGASGAAAGTRKTHTVVSGDTLWGIASRYNLTLNALLALNPQIQNPNLIYPGQTITVQ
jgi:spore coat assembly protein SafA